MLLLKCTYLYETANAGDIHQAILSCLLLTSLPICSAFRSVLELPNCLCFLVFLKWLLSLVFKWEIRWEPSSEFTVVFQYPCECGMVTFKLTYSPRNSPSKYWNQHSLYKMNVQYLSICVPPYTLDYYHLLSYGTLNRSAPAQAWDTRTQGKLKKEYIIVK